MLEKNYLQAKKNTGKIKILEGEKDGFHNINFEQKSHESQTTL